MSHLAHLILSRISLIGLVFLATTNGHGQTKSQSRFISPADQEISIKNVTAAPLLDNVSGIYAKPLGEALRERLANDPTWSLVAFPEKSVKLEALDSRADDVKKILQQTKADALLSGKITKGPSGINIRLVLSVGASGLPLIIEEANEASRFETAQLQTITLSLLEKIKEKMPYRGTLLSRKAQQVTLNLGKSSGIKNGDELTVIQILKINRHPKLGFMVSSDKEILGKVKVFKADDELSFANIILEKEANLLEPGMKLIPETMVAYPTPVVSPDGKVLEDLSQRADRPVAFGEKPVEWLPEHPPQYGRVQIMAGLGQYNQSLKMQTAGNVDGSNTFAPNIALAVEGWITRDWFVGFDLRQSAFSITNGLSGSSPSSVNMSVSRYDVIAGHNFILGEDFFGPKIQLSLGMGKFTARADESTPIAFSNMEFGGTQIGFVFTTPLAPELAWDLGARLQYYWSAGVSESVSSGSTKSVNISDFGFLLGYRVRPNFRYIGDFNMEYYSSDFNGNGSRPDPTTSIAHRMTTLLVGLEYLF